MQTIHPNQLNQSKHISIIKIKGKMPHIKLVDTVYHLSDANYQLLREEMFKGTKITKENLVAKFEAKKIPLNFINKKIEI